MKSSGWSHEDSRDKNERRLTIERQLASSVLAGIYLFKRCMCGYDETWINVDVIMLGIVIEQYYRLNYVTEHHDGRVKYG